MSADEIGRWVERLPLDKHRLDDELIGQSSSFALIGISAASAARAVAEAKLELKRSRAQIANRMLAVNGKATIAQVDDACALDAAYIRLERAVIDATEHHDKWSAVEKAWHQRGFDAKALCELYASDYFAATTGASVKGERGVDEVAYRARRAIRDASRDAG